MSVVLDLRQEPSWEPGRLTSESFRWPVDYPSAAVGDVAQRLFPRTFAEAGSPVITPANVDESSGGIRRRSREYQGSVFQVGSDLRPGDLLLPPAPTSPAILVSEDLRGALVSARFLAIRPMNRELGLWLWGLLSSESGRNFRANLSLGTSLESLNASDLFDAAVPVPALGPARALAGVLAEVHLTTRIEEEEAPETWWHTVDLRETEWRLALATPQTGVLDEGEPLEHFCSEIVSGRRTGSNHLAGDVPGYLPVFDISALGGKPVRRWAPPEHGRSVVAKPGDLLLARSGNLPRARIADRPLVADQHVYVVRLRDPRNGPALTSFLNSRDGYRVRQVLLTGTTVPSLSATDLRRLPIPASALDLPVASTTDVVLARRLEETLWQI